jgi:hypothetical protein
MRSRALVLPLCRQCQCVPAVPGAPAPPAVASSQGDLGLGAWGLGLGARGWLNCWLVPPVGYPLPPARPAPAQARRRRRAWRTLERPIPEAAGAGSYLNKFPTDAPAHDKPETTHCGFGSGGSLAIDCALENPKLRPQVNYYP